MYTYKIPAVRPGPARRRPAARTGPVRRALPGDQKFVRLRAKEIKKETHIHSPPRAPTKHF